MSHEPTPDERRVTAMAITLAIYAAELGDEFALGMARLDAGTLGIPSDCPPDLREGIEANVAGFRASVDSVYERLKEEES